MARIYANENFPADVIVCLRQLGHDVLTTHESGMSNQSIPDEDVKIRPRKAKKEDLTRRMRRPSKAKWAYMQCSAISFLHYSIITYIYIPVNRGSAEEVNNIKFSVFVKGFSNLLPA